MKMRLPKVKRFTTYFKSRLPRITNFGKEFQNFRRNKNKLFEIGNLPGKEVINVVLQIV